MANSLLSLSFLTVILNMAISLKSNHCGQVHRKEFNPNIKLLLEELEAHRIMEINRDVYVYATAHVYQDYPKVIQLPDSSRKPDFKLKELLNCFHSYLFHSKYQLQQLSITPKKGFIKPQLKHFWFKLKAFKTLISNLGQCKSPW